MFVSPNLFPKRESVTIVKAIFTTMSLTAIDQRAFASQPESFKIQKSKKPDSFESAFNNRCLAMSYAHMSLINMSHTTINARVLFYP